MAKPIEDLESSRDRWRSGARYDRNQLLASFTMSASGLVIAGIGIGQIIEGNPRGGIFLAGGTALGIMMTKLGLFELQDHVHASEIAAVRQHQIDEISNDTLDDVTSLS